MIKDFNSRAVELWGREPVLGDKQDRFCGSFKMFLSDGSFLPHAQCPMADVLSGKIAQANDAEVLIERPDGSRITIIVNIRPLKDERAEIAGAINCFYDVTERKQAEVERDKLLDSERAALAQAEGAGLVPALALTGYAREVDELQAREAGFQMHLTKPVLADVLIAAVANLALRRIHPQSSTMV